MTRDEILLKVQEIMVEMFEIDAGDVSLDAHLVDDLDLDSIDAIDMVLKLQEITGERVPEEQLKAIRTVADIVDLVASKVGEP